MGSTSPSRRIRVRLASKFFGLLGLLLATTLAVGAAGVLGLRQTQADADRLYNSHLLRSELTTTLGTNLDDTSETALQLVPTTDAAQLKLLDVKLDNQLIPDVSGGIDALRRAHASGAPAERTQVERIAAGWEKFLALRRAGALDRTCCGQALAAFDNDLVLRLAQIFDPLDELIEGLDAVALERPATIAIARSTRTRGPAF